MNPKKRPRVRGKLKFPFALCNGVPIHISKVSGGRKTDCACPCCRGPLIAKKGKIKRHHFAHDPGSQCNLESVLHWFGKTLIRDGIEKALKERRPLPLHWLCSQCGDEHHRNLLKKAASVQLESNLGPVRPDILLLDQRNNPVAAMELIVTHAPEQPTLEFYQRSHIVVVQIQLDGYDALEALHDLKEVRASAVSLCTRPKCDQCAGPLSEKFLYLCSVGCYYCCKPIKIAYMEIEEKRYLPNTFPSRELEIARINGCVLTEKYGRPRKRSYLANTCPACKSFILGPCLPLSIFLATGEKTFVTGQFCKKCQKHFDTPFPIPSPAS
ncbi:MAG: competence protein CoiA family protein [bacterium]